MGGKKRYSEPTDLAAFVNSQVSPPVVADISIDKLLDDGLTTLYREMKNILVMSSKGKLDPNSARDLRDHLKLLFELKDREMSWLKGLSDEQLKELSAKAQETKPEEKI